MQNLPEISEYFAEEPSQVSWMLTELMVVVARSSKPDPVNSSWTKPSYRFPESGEYQHLTKVLSVEKEMGEIIP